MATNGYDKEIAKIRAETEKIKKQIMQLEFQSKKDSVEAKRDFEARDRAIQQRIDYIAKLAGITYDELDKLDEKTQEAGRGLARPREHSKLHG